MNYTEHFSFNCECCDFHTNVKSNYTAHMKSKKHLKKVSGEDPFYCCKCCYRAKTKGDFLKHLATQKCINKHKTNKDKPIDIITKIQKNIENKYIEMDTLNEDIEEWQDINQLLIITINSGNFTRYTYPQLYLDMEEQWDKLNIEIEQLDKKLRWWATRIYKMTKNNLPINQLLKAWREKASQYIITF